MILFTLVVGTFPFMHASHTDKFYSLIREDKRDLYFTRARADNLSLEFKDLFYALVSPDGTKRPTLGQIRAHPWFNHSSADLLAKKELIHKSAALFCPLDSIQEDLDTLMMSISPTDEYQLNEKRTPSGSGSVSSGRSTQVSL